MSAVTIAFDTLAYANKLKAAGLDSHIAEVQAEAQAEILTALIKEQLVTKEELNGSEVATKQDIKALAVDVEKLAQEIKMLEATTKRNMKSLEKDLTVKMGAMIFSSFTALATLMTVLHFH